jgi:hypothetical protein
MASKSSHPLGSLLMGGVSLGALITEAIGSIGSIPSPTHPSPQKLAYYTGGYTVQKYGSNSFFENINAIQIELPSVFRNNNRELMSNSTNLASAIAKFYKTHMLMLRLPSMTNWPEKTE